jgi:hypothetical protein
VVADLDSGVNWNSVIVLAKQFPSFSISLHCHFLYVIPAKAGICHKALDLRQIPAFAGMTDTKQWNVLRRLKLLT